MKKSLKVRLFLLTLSDDLTLWRDRTLIGDWTQSWQTPFIEFANLKQRVKPENLMLLADNEKAKHLFAEVTNVRVQAQGAR
jgi:hypothetical protein